MGVLTRWRKRWCSRRSSARLTRRRSRLTPSRWPLRCALSHCILRTLLKTIEIPIGALAIPIETRLSHAAGPCQQLSQRSSTPPVAVARASCWLVWWVGVKVRVGAMVVISTLYVGKSHAGRMCVSFFDGASRDENDRVD